MVADNPQSSSSVVPIFNADDGFPGCWLLSPSSAFTRGACSRPTCAPPPSLCVAGSSDHASRRFWDVYSCGIVLLEKYFPSSLLLVPHRQKLFVVTLNTSSFACAILLWRHTPNELCSLHDFGSFLLLLDIVCGSSLGLNLGFIIPTHLYSGRCTFWIVFLHIPHCYFRLSSFHCLQGQANLCKVLLHMQQDHLLYLPKS